MFWNDWFTPSKIELPKQEDTWKTSTIPMDSNFPFEKLKVFADSEGDIKLDINGYFLTIPAAVRHQFLEKIQRAVDMADVADPSNEPLIRGINGEKT